MRRTRRRIGQSGGIRNAGSRRFAEQILRFPDAGTKSDDGRFSRGGSLSEMNVHSKELVVGTKSTTIDVPKVETTKKKVDVPVVGVKNN